MKKYSQAEKLAYYKKLAKGKSSTISGRGAYYKNQPRTRGPYIRGKGAYAKDYGQRLGSVVGEGLQELFTQANPLKLLGFGDYVPTPFKVMQNTLLSMGNDPPEIQNAIDGRFIIRHREYLRDIVTGAAGAFNIQAFDINPGLETTFPWLAQISQAFEQYIMRGMIFEFKSTSADALNSTNTALGTVIMATQYDALKPVFVNKQEMENHQYAASAKQSCSMLHPVECARNASVLDHLYIRTGAVPPDADQRLYDFGKFQIATVGQQAANVNIGELWVTYEIELLKPQINEVGAIQQSNYYYNATTVAAATPLGSQSGLEGSSKNNIPITISATNRTLTFPKGTYGCYLLMYQMRGDVAAGVVVPNITPSTGITISSAIAPFIAIISPNTGDSSTRATMCTFFQVSGQNTDGTDPSLTFGTGGTFPTTNVLMHLYITAVVDGMAASTVGPLVSSSDLFEQFQKQYMSDMFREYLKTKAIENKPEEETSNSDTPPSNTKSEVGDKDLKEEHFIKLMKEKYLGK